MKHQKKTKIEALQNTVEEQRLTIRRIMHVIKGDYDKIYWSSPSFECGKELESKLMKLNGQE